MATGGQSLQFPAVDMRLRTQLTRNPEAFALRRYVPMLSDVKPDGYYITFGGNSSNTVEDGGTGNWADGAERPIGRPTTHTWQSYRTQRHSVGDRKGSLAVQTADVDAQTAVFEHLMPNMMTRMTLAAETALVRPGIFSTATATAAAGGKPGAGTTANPYIQALFNVAANTIIKNTNSSVQRSQIKAVFGYGLAQEIAQSAEYREYHLRNERYISHLLDDGELLPRLYGIECVVHQETVRTSLNGTPRYFYDGLGTIDSVAVGSAIVFMVNAEKGVEMPNVSGGSLYSADKTRQSVNAPTTSTLVQMTHQDVTAEANVDTWNRINDYAVSADFAMTRTSTASAYVATACQA